jgi:DNA polymerase I-like protein with 3'-5' exonuclease and polymerase domains
MSDPDFDAHLDLAVQQGVITKADAVAHVRKEKDLSKIRKPYKAVNYSAIYGVGPPKLSRELGIPEPSAKKLLEAYWKRNWSIRKLAEDQRIRTIKGQMWLFNPVSKFWYSLRYTKDIFSTLNQGTGVFAFDTWISFILAERKQLTAQFHDEVVLEIKKGFREQATDLLRTAIQKTNDKLKLNIQLNISLAFGETYGQIH